MNTILLTLLLQSSPLVPVTTCQWPNTCEAPITTCQTPNSCA